MVDEQGERIVQRLIEDEMKSSYLDYSMSVIVGRALPDARDGLKPVHRRVLYAMADMGLLHNKPLKKAARIVGEVLGKYHPHGDMAVYDTLVRMAQEFSLRYPLIQGQGNFGSIDGDSAAAMRYTEARLKAIAEEIMQDIHKKTVPFAPNFDNSLKEPLVLPSKVPTLLINGSSGIAVGMATSIPPHNISEVTDGIIHWIDNPESTNEELMKFIPAPDFPTGGIICGSEGLKQAYTTGRGKIKLRGKIHIEEGKGKNKIVITEIPYMTNKANLVEQIAHLIRDKRIQGVSDLRDESDRDGIRVVLELRQGANSDVICNQLYAHSRLQDTFSIILLALVENQPKILTLRDLITEFVTHRQQVVRKRTEFDLAKAEARKHILEGLLVALKNIDAVVSLIKKSQSAAQALTRLMESYTLTKIQAQSVLDMRLQRLTGLEQMKITQEHQQLIVLIKELMEILGSESKILSLIKQELAELKQKYGDERRTQVMATASIMEEEELIKPEDVVVTVTHAGYVKRLPVDTYKAQRRGGKGIIGTETKEHDFVEQLFLANTHNYLLCFTNLGKIHWLKVHRLPEAKRYAKGTAIRNLLELRENEKVTTLIPVKEFTPDMFLFMVTKKGIVKKTALQEFSNPRKGGIIALSLTQKDELMTVLQTTGKDEVIIATANGMAIRFKEGDVRPMGRTASGVIGIRLRNDTVVGAVRADERKSLMTITENGFGKRSMISDYRLTSRGGVGVINIKITQKNGKVVEVKSVTDDDEIMFISQKGIVLRTAAKQIRETGRNTQGVVVMRISGEDKVVSAATIISE